MSDTETKSVPKLSVKPPGYWRNKFHSEKDAVFGDGTVNPAGEWFAVMRWPSRDVAETRAQQHMAEYAGWTAATGITYLGAVHFPEDAQ
jgi:hypothetical protein